MGWTWTARKWGISAFVLAHVIALGVWNLPPKSALHQRLAPAFRWYLLPTGLWQDWGMFAPDPAPSTVVLEGVAVDRHGVVRRYEFPALTGLSVPAASWRFRHAKYASVVGLDDSAAHREFAARTVLRRLPVAEEAYPVDVQLLYRVQDTAPPGEPDEPPPPPRSAILGTYRFPNRAEIAP